MDEADVDGEMLEHPTGEQRIGAKPHSSANARMWLPGPGDLELEPVDQVERRLRDEGVSVA